jgi:hypothetical protein
MPPGSGPDADSDAGDLPGGRADAEPKASFGPADPGST